jgi:hypothetical protein
MYGIGRAEAARFERHSRCFELHSRVLRASRPGGRPASSNLIIRYTSWVRPE